MKLIFLLAVNVIRMMNPHTRNYSISFRVLLSWDELRDTSRSLLSQMIHGSWKTLMAVQKVHSTHKM
ncbi:hypothetical protein C450_06140 [Halococcus salifodinae DSM 8989]|uniref:Uncharacterized protein n=1 Tax=Halococcus salifodinae DSM 8989 TaxID=1227456 RepID=M0N8T9_9EURY|nr:hypothetical protein C450_06140 [Halococcus salifodinae DSM 8989]